MSRQFLCAYTVCNVIIKIMKKNKGHRACLCGTAADIAHSCVLRLDSATNSVGFDFKEKYSSHLCETWQTGSLPRLHPFDRFFYCYSESRDSHLPCNGQNVSLKMGNT